MNAPIDYSNEGRNKIEIDKLHAEVAEMRSRFRRWIGSLGGLLGIMTAAVSIIVTSQQMDRSSRQSALEQTKLETARAKFDADRARFDADQAQVARAAAEARGIEARQLEEKSKQRVQEMEKDLAEMEKKKKEAEALAANNLAVAAQARVEAEGSSAELKKRKDELEAVQVKLAELARSLQEKAGQAQGAVTVKALAESTRELIASERDRLADDKNKPRLYVFVLDARQKEKAWELEKPLQAAGIAMGNVLVFAGKREETPVLRYFRDQDKEEAQKISGVLGQQGLQRIRVSRVNDPESAGTGRKFQLWVRSENFRDQAPSPPFEGSLPFEVSEYSIVSRQLKNGLWLSVYVGNPNDDDPFRCVIYSSAKDETTEKGARRDFPAPKDRFCDTVLLPDKTRRKQGAKPFEMDAFDGKLRATIPTSSFRKAILELSWSPN